ncbi:T9SS type A sorting domain-containing protein, partial [candidate division KSB1 bacterium]|nr:T9SS type A sorting domain-containing protein [candidate division KSB1 bacterium]
AWNGRDQSGKSVASGVYLYRLKAENYQVTKKLILMR